MRFTHNLEIHQDVNGKWWLTWSDRHVYSGPFPSRYAAQTKLTELMCLDN